METQKLAKVDNLVGKKVTKLKNLVGKKWLNFVQVANFFADFLFLPTKIFADFLFTDKVPPTAYHTA